MLPSFFLLQFSLDFSADASLQVDETWKQPGSFLNVRFFAVSRHRPQIKTYWKAPSWLCGMPPQIDRSSLETPNWETYILIRYMYLKVTRDL